MIDDIEVLEIWITPQENLVIIYQYTQDGKSIARTVTPEFIELPHRPSIWD